MTDRDIVEILGRAAASHFRTAEALTHVLPGARYLHLSNEEWLELAKKEASDGMRVYWSEILYRAHFCSLVSLIRTRRWVDGLTSMAQAGNYLAFMANYRGFLESSADSYYSLGRVGLWLADFHVVIRMALEGRLEQPTVFRDIEDLLIHFAHARRLGKGEAAPDEHRARTTRAYIESLAGPEDNRVAQCYAHLCDATHPAVGSLLCYVDATASSDTEGFGVTATQDHGWIRSFLRDYQDVSGRLMFLAVVPSMMILRVLNEFPLNSVRTEAAYHVAAETHPMWPDFASRLADQRLPHERYPAGSTDSNEVSRVTG